AAYDRFIPGVNSSDPRTFHLKQFPPTEPPEVVISGSNVAVIQLPDDPTQPAQLLGATRQIPGGYADNLVLSNDNHFLYAAYRGIGAVFAFDVVELLKTVRDPVRTNFLHNTSIDYVDLLVDLGGSITGGHARANWDIGKIYNDDGTQVADVFGSSSF